MNICMICKSPKRAEVDARLLAGGTHASIGKALGFDRQVVGRHSRNGHVARGNPAAGAGWARSEPAEISDEDDELAVRAATAALTVLLAGDAAAVDRAQGDPKFDWLADRVAEYRTATVQS